jgi:hypothetical protein
MAKSLGQIHVVNSIFPVNNTTGDKFNIDLPGQLTSQLQTMVRAGTYHKVVGIDMTLDTQGTLGGGQVSGSILYYAPTHGRCSAYRAAFKSMAEVMKTQGISMRENRLYDFKAPINVAGTVNVFQNQATLDGTNGLALNNTVNAGASIFGVHNKSVRPQYTGTTGDLFQPGFDTILQSSATGTDFVLNDTVPFTGDRDVAATEYESIPFTLTWTPDTTDLAIGMEWRPDPALFLAVMCGQLQVVIEEFNADGGSPGVNINIAVMVSGWKSIMGDPSKKKVRKSRTRNLAIALAPKLHRK